MARIDIGAIIIGTFALVVGIVALIFTLTAQSKTEDVANDVKEKVLQLSRGLGSLHQAVSARPPVHHQRAYKQQHSAGPATHGKLPAMPQHAAQAPQGQHHMTQLKQIMHRQDVMRPAHEMGPMDKEQAPGYSVENAYPSLPPAMERVVDENITSGPVGRFFDDEYSKY